MNRISASVSCKRAYCRHYAYCVPYTPRSSLALNAVTTVVVSPRINDAQDSIGRGILVHELGHCIDFHCFGSRCDLSLEDNVEIPVNRGMGTSLVFMSL